MSRLLTRDPSLAAAFLEQPDPVLLANREGLIVVANRSAERLLRREAGSLEGEPLTGILAGGPAQELGQLGQLGPFERLLNPDRQTQPLHQETLRARAVRSDGSELDVELVLAGVGPPDDPAFLFVVCLRDLTERAAYEHQADLSRYLTAGLQVARSVAAAPGPTEAYKAVLPALCPELGCDVARLWLREPAGREMVCVDWWWAASRHRDAAEPPFGVTCAPGVGVAGECWAAGHPMVVAVAGTDQLFPNQAVLAEAGITTAAAAPMQGVDGTVGVLTLFYSGDRSVDEEGLSLLQMLGDAVGAVIEAKQRTAASREELRRNELLLDASSAVAGAGGYSEALHMLAASSVPGLGDLCLIDVVTPEGELARAAAVHADPTKAALVKELETQFVPRVGSAHPAGQVTATGRSMWSATMPADFLQATTRSRRHYEIVTALGFQSYMSIPLRADDEVLGALTLISSGSGRIFSEDDLATGERLAAQVAGTIARARELDRGQQRAAELEERSQALLELGTELSAAQSVADVLEALLGSPVCSLGAAGARIALLDESRTLLHMTFAGDVPAEYTNRYHVLAIDAPVPIVDVVRDNRSFMAGDTLKVEARLRPSLNDERDAVRAVALEPLRAEDGSTLGAVGLSWPEVREFSAEQEEMIAGVGAAISRAVARILVSEREHQVAAALQERLLALDIGTPAVAIAAMYRPLAADTMRVGGDWYTARVLDGPDRIGISVGDVVGHGLGAVTTMSQLRSALDIAALGDSDPAAVLSLLDRYARGVPDASCATVAYAHVDLSARTIRYACAGHPYPLLVTPTGDVQYLTDGRAAPLGIQEPGPSVVSGSAMLPVGSLLVLYSDGLVERHGESLQAGLDRLASVAAACSQLATSEVCSRLLAEMAEADGYRDDVAVVALRPAGDTETSHIDCISASLEQISEARHRLRSWLRTLDLDRQVAYDVLLAVGEAVNNAVEHASDTDPRKFVYLEAFATEGLVRVSVTDSGQWTKDSGVSRRSSDRGRGLTLMHGLSQSVDLVRSQMGTRVTMSFGRARAEVSR